MLSEQLEYNKVVCYIDDEVIITRVDMNLFENTDHSGNNRCQYRLDNGPYRQFMRTRIGLVTGYAIGSRVCIQLLDGIDFRTIYNTFVQGYRLYIGWSHFMLVEGSNTNSRNCYLYAYGDDKSILDDDTYKFIREIRHDYSIKIDLLRSGYMFSIGGILEGYRSTLYDYDTGEVVEDKKVKRIIAHTWDNASLRSNSHHITIKYGSNHSPLSKFKMRNKNSYSAHLSGNFIYILTVNDSGNYNIMIIDISIEAHTVIEN